MDLKSALREQHIGGLAMLDECIEKAPDDLWACPGSNGSRERSFWRIAWHALYFTHCYLVQSTDDFNGSTAEWPDAIRRKLGVDSEQAATEVEPYELPEDAEPVTREEMREYVAYLGGLVGPTIASLDLDREDTGFNWYPEMSKLSHELMNLRHLQGHVGQLSELLMMRGIDISWIARADSPSKRGRI